jgi:dGTP triphosphohydrolase
VYKPQHASLYAVPAVLLTVYPSCKFSQFCASQIEAHCVSTTIDSVSLSTMHEVLHEAVSIVLVHCVIRLPYYSRLLVCMYTVYTTLLYAYCTQVAARQAELQRMRALLFYHERKRHHINKIKSKVYRKVCVYVCAYTSESCSMTLMILAQCVDLFTVAHRH